MNLFNKQEFIKACNCGETTHCMQCGKPVDTDTAENPFFCNGVCQLKFNMQKTKLPRVDSQNIVLPTGETISLADFKEQCRKIQKEQGETR
jgi:hypothetical protein